MSDQHRGDPPSPFVVRWAQKLFTTLPPRRRALDVAMGRGRHVEALAAIGYRTFGVDANAAAVREAVNRTAARGLSINAWVADLTAYPLPSSSFELVAVTRYLQRNLFAALQECLVPGGVILYETFTEAQLRLGFGPTSPVHLLTPLELLRSFDGLDVLSYEEIDEPEAVARLAARRRAVNRSKASLGSDTLPSPAAPWD